MQVEMLLEEARYYDIQVMIKQLEELKSKQNKQKKKQLVKSDGADACVSTSKLKALETFP